MNNTQGSVRVALPEELQTEINIGTQKVQVLREQKTELERGCTAVEKDIARFQLERDELLLAVTAVQAERASVAAKLIDEQRKLADIEGERPLVYADLSTANRELIESKEKTAEEAKKLSDIVVRAREVEAEIMTKKEELTKEVAAFEARKARLQETLASI